MLPQIQANRKKIWIGAAVIMLILLFLTAYFVKMKSGSAARFSRTSSAPSQKPLPPKLNSDQIATLILQWANNTRTGNQAYASGEDCDQGGVCAPLMANNGVGAAAIWARYRFYLKNKNSEAMKIMDTDIKTYVDSEKVITIQPYFWSCKLLYEMFMSKVFSQDQKWGLQTICARSIYNSIDLSYVKGTPNAQAVAAKIRQNISGQASEKDFFTENPDPRRVNEYAVQASERTAMYLWAKDPSDLEQAQLYFVAAMDALQSVSDRITAADEFPMVGLAALDLNRIIPDPLLPGYAEELHKRYKETDCTHVQSCVMRAYFYNELSKVTQKTSYKTAADVLIDRLYVTQFDYQDTKGYFAGKQALYDKGLNVSYDMIPNMMYAALVLDR